MKINSKQQEEVLAFAKQLVRAPGHSGDEEQTALLIEEKMSWVVFRHRSGSEKSSEQMPLQDGKKR